MTFLCNGCTSDSEHRQLPHAFTMNVLRTTVFSIDTEPNELEHKFFTRTHVKKHKSHVNGQSVRMFGGGD